MVDDTGTPPGVPQGKLPIPEPPAKPPPETADSVGSDQATTTDESQLPANLAASPPPEPLVEMPVHIFVLAVIYLALLFAIFITYSTWSSFRLRAPASFGQLPVGVVWFGATGAVIASLYGIFVHNREWKMSYNYWHYCRPMFGAVTGSIGTLIYLVLLNLGNASSVKVDRLTFYVVAFVFGFADKSFIQELQNVTNVIIKPGNKAS